MEPSPSHSVNAIVHTILDSPNFRTELENVVSNVVASEITQHRLRNISSTITTTSTSAINGRTPPVRSAREEFQNLFKPRTFPSSRVSKKTSKKHFKDAYASYIKEVIILDSPGTRTLSAKLKSEATAQKRIKRVSFRKDWNYEEVIQHIKNTFKSALSDNEHVNLSIKMPMGRILVDLPLEPGETCDGVVLHQYFAAKSIYVIPDQILYMNSNYAGDSTQYEVNYRDDSLNMQRQEMSHILNTDNSGDMENTDSLDKSNEEDPDLFKAIQESLLTNKKERNNTLKEELEVLKLQIKEIDVTLINMDRNDPIGSVIRCTSRKNFCPWNRISVLFTDEEAADLGGPKREMFRLLMQSLQDSSYFEGEENMKRITFHIDKWQKKKYLEVGKMIALSLLHGGPGPRFFSKLFFEMVFKPDAEQEELIDMSKIYDYEIKLELEKVKLAENTDSLKTAVESSNYLQFLGVSANITDMEEKDSLLNGALKYYTYFHNAQSKQQFIDGLNMFGLYDILRKYPDDTKKLFCFEECTKLTAIKIIQLFKINFSLQGTQKYIIENRIISFWRDYLQRCEDMETSVTLANILSFVTGADHEPPLGFLTSPNIIFIHENDSKYPKANACSLTLNLPVGEADIDNFVADMD